jgi:hypothetical protein
VEIEISKTLVAAQWRRKLGKVVLTHIKTSSFNVQPMSSLLCLDKLTLIRLIISSRWCERTLPGKKWGTEAMRHFLLAAISLSIFKKEKSTHERCQKNPKILFDFFK